MKEQGGTIIAPEDRTSKPNFEEASRKPEPKKQERGSSMVEEDRPHPELRPSPDFAQDVDRAAFDERWAREVRGADDHLRAAQRHAFKAKRREKNGQGRTHNFNRNASDE